MSSASSIEPSPRPPPLAANVDEGGRSICRPTAIPELGAAVLGHFRALDRRPGIAARIIPSSRGSAVRRDGQNCPQSGHTRHLRRRVLGAHGADGSSRTGVPFPAQLCLSRVRLRVGGGPCHGCDEFRSRVVAVRADAGSRRLGGHSAVDRRHDGVDRRVAALPALEGDPLGCHARRCRERGARPARHPMVAYPGAVAPRHASAGARLGDRDDVLRELASRVPCRSCCCSRWRLIGSNGPGRGGSSSRSRRGCYWPSHPGRSATIESSTRSCSCGATSDWSSACRITRTRMSWAWTTIRSGSPTPTFSAIIPG